MKFKTIIRINCLPSAYDSGIVQEDRKYGRVVIQWSGLTARYGVRLTHRLDISLELHTRMGRDA